MAYLLVKWIHVTAAFVSISGFVVRGIWMLSDSPRFRARWVRVAPHIVDTVLLASAVVLAAMLHQYPIAHHWLSAKVVGLLAYIGLGMVAFRFGRSRRIRALAFLGALLVAAYIVTVAWFKSPLGPIR